MRQKSSVILFKSIFCFLLLTSPPLFASTETATIIFTGNMPEVAVSGRGGYAELGTLLKQTRAQHQPTFFLFSGASLGPSSLSTLDRGSHIIDILNTLEPDAMAVSKREFSYFEDELSLRSYEAAFPLVSSNIYDPLTQGNLDGLVDSIVIEKGQYRLGVLSIVDQSVIEEYAVKRLQILDPIKAVTHQAQLMRQQGVDLIVLIYSVDVADVNQLLDKHIVDLTLHKDNYFEIESLTPYQPHINDVFLTEPGVAAEIRLTWQKGKHETLTLDWQKHYLNQYDKLPQVAEQIAGYSARLNRLLTQPIGVSSTPIDCRRLQLRTRENAFGNFLADSIRTYTGADIALLNSGAIRGDKLYPADYSLTRKDIADILPYRAEIIVLDVTGQQIIAALENSLGSIEQVKGRFLQVSGLKVVYNSAQPPGQRVVSVQINHQAIIADKHYQLATTDYLTEGGDGYSVFSNSAKINNHKQVTRLLSDIAINQIIKQQVISPGIESRLTDLATAN